jgi:hypothetical protein
MVIIISAARLDRRRIDARHDRSSASPLYAAVRKGACPTGVYNVGKVDTITDGRDSFYGFNVIGIHGPPLISFSFETGKKAEAAHKAMLAIVATAKVITPYALSR